MVPASSFLTSIGRPRRCPYEKPQLTREWPTADRSNGDQNDRATTNQSPRLHHNEQSAGNRRKSEAAVTSCKKHALLTIMCGP